MNYGPYRDCHSKNVNSLSSRGRLIIGADIKHFVRLSISAIFKNRFADKVFFFYYANNIITGDMVNK